MATSVQEKVILNSSDATAPAPASPAIPVLIPFIPVEAPSLEGRAQSLDDKVHEFTDSDLEEEGIERWERFKGVSPEELREIIDWVRANPQLTNENILTAAHGASPREAEEDGFVIVESSASDQSTKSEKKSQPGLMSRIGRSFRSAVSYFYSAKK